MGNFKLVNLLRWKEEIPLKDTSDKPILDGNKPVTVWMRIIGDSDQQEAYRMARIKSAEKRLALRDITSPDYLDQVQPITEADRETCVELIRASRGSNFTSEALANVERPDLPKMEEIAKDADAPTLEEQEQMDKVIANMEKEYQAAIDEYITTRRTELDSELKDMPLDQLRVQAMYETSNALALGVFLQEVQLEKVWRSVYMDEACQIPGYESVEEFKSQHSHIKNQLIKAYEKLETPPEEVKN